MEDEGKGKRKESNTKATKTQTMLILNNTAGILIHNPIQYSFHSAVTCVLVLHLVEVSRAISVPKVGHQLLWLPYQLKRSVHKSNMTQLASMFVQEAYTD